MLLHLLLLTENVPGQVCAQEGLLQSARAVTMDTWHIVSKLC